MSGSSRTLSEFQFSLALGFGIDTKHAVDWLQHSALDLALLLAVATMGVLPVPFVLSLDALATRTLGPLRPGVISRWAPSYLRVWLKAELLQSASDWLSGALFWPARLRAAGMGVGPGCEISTILDVVPERVKIGPECFFADGIYLGGPLIHRGTVANDRRVRPGSSWFGHPPFELPRREVVACDRSLTHEPSFIRYWNRVFWESARVLLPILPALSLPLWYNALAIAEASYTLPLVNLAFAAFFRLCFLAKKWFLLGRVKPGQHPLGSCWCDRWGFLYVAWGMYPRAGLSALEGTLFLTWYLRLAGMRIGEGAPQRRHEA